jgi:hypothetical protein
MGPCPLLRESDLLFADTLLPVASEILKFPRPPTGSLSDGISRTPRETRPESSLITRLSLISHHTQA